MRRIGVALVWLACADGSDATRLIPTDRIGLPTTSRRPELAAPAASTPARAPAPPDDAADATSPADAQRPPSPPPRDATGSMTAPRAGGDAGADAPVASPDAGGRGEPGPSGEPGEPAAPVEPPAAELAPCAPPGEAFAARAGPAVLDVAVGVQHTCALLEGGRVRCWGQGSQGELGYGDRRDRDLGVRELGDVSLGAPATQLALGDYHGCALLDGGQVRCWGSSAGGELGVPGIDRIGDDELPSDVAPVELGEPATHIAAAAGGTCAVLASGAVRCWGAVEGLGPDGPRRVGLEQTPAEVPAIRLGARATRVARGAQHACALMETGGVRCWGRNNWGQLGLGHDDSIGRAQHPEDVDEVSVAEPFTEIFAGQQHTCALTASGNAQCWGSNASGETGHLESNRIADDLPLDRFDLLDFGGRARSLALGNRFTCWLDDAGDVRCWGQNLVGELGRGNLDNPVPLARACPIDLGGAARRIVSAREHSCAVLESGALICWGHGKGAQLGLASRESVGDDETPASLGPLAFADP